MVERGAKRRITDDLLPVRDVGGGWGLRGGVCHLEMQLRPFEHVVGRREQHPHRMSSHKIIRLCACDAAHAQGVRAMVP